MLRTFCLVAGAAGIILFSLPFFAGIFGAGSVAGTFLSLLFFLGWLYEKDLKLCTGLLRYVCLAAQAGYLIFFVTAAAACFCMYRSCRNFPQEGRPATVVILGCGLEGDRPSLSLLYRLQCAGSYLSTHPDVPVVVSGGQGADEVMSEAECMYGWLVSHGISSERIYQEDRSSSTYENLSFTRDVILQNGLPEEIIIVSNSFHLYRASVIGAKLGYTCTSLPAKTTWWLFPSSVLREVLGIILEWVTP